MIKAVIFDCFGVLVNDSLQQMCDELAEKDPKKAQEVLDLIHASSRGLINYDESSKQIADLFGLTKEEYIKHRSKGEIRNQSLLDYIETLRKDYKTGMLSNISNGGLLKRFHVDELKKYFDATIASGEIGFAKPEAQSYEITATELGVRLDECVFTDDREEYCDGAKGVGMKVILFTTTNQFKRDLKEILQN